MVRLTQKSSILVGISVDIFVYTPVCIFLSTFVREFVGSNFAVRVLSIFLIFSQVNVEEAFLGRICGDFPFKSPQLVTVEREQTPHQSARIWGGGIHSA